MSGGALVPPDGVDRCVQPPRQPTALEHFRGRLRGGVRADVLLPSKSYAVQSTLLEYRLLSSVAEFETLEVEGDHREVDDDVARHATDDVGRPPTTALRTADDLADSRARSDY